MDCLIIGAGAVGLSIGAALKASGVSVSFFTTGETKRAIDEEGLHRTGLFGTLDFPAGSVKTYEAYKALPDRTFDYVLISAKSMANQEISQKLSEQKRVLTENGVIVILQNGWGNDAPFLRYFAKEKVYHARIITGFRRTAPNVSDITVHTQPILLGSLYQCDPVVLEPLAQAICAFNPPCEVTKEVGKALWAKMLYNCTLNPLGAVLRLSYGKLSESEDAVAIMNELIIEIYKVMHGAGYDTFWETPEQYQNVFYEKLVPETYDHRSSTLQDIERKRKTEIDTLTGCIINLAKEHGISVPYHTMLYHMIRTIESSF